MLKRIALFIALVLPIFMIGVDLLVIGVAVAPMAKTFQVPVSTVQWFVTAYAVGYAAFVGASGRLSEIVGQKTFLIAGLAIFAATSLIISMADHSGLVITARIFQGISAGMMATTAIAIVMTTFESQHEQAVWIGSLVGMAGLGMALAPPIGGLMINYWSWRSVFLINVPIGIITILAALYAIKPYPRNKSQSLDFRGLVLLVITIFSLVLLVSQGSVWGFTSHLFAMFTIIFIIAGTLLIINELRVRNPLLDLSLFKFTNFTAANLAGFSFYFILLGQILIWGIYLEKAFGLDALQVGMRLLPIGFMMALGSFVLRGVIEKVSDKTLMIIGALLALFSSAWLALLPFHIQYWELAFGLACFGLGFFLVNSISTNTALRFLPQAKISLGSSMCMMLRWLGSSFGSALSSVVFVAYERHAITKDQSHINAQLPNNLMQALHHGLVSTQWLFAIMSLLVAVLILTCIKAEVV